jgi:hypothetical protein
MALRSLLRRFREHDWLGACVEVVIVVVGVFLGLQASNWNQDRLEAIRGREYLRRLHADLDSEASLLRRTLDFERAVDAYGEGAVAYAESGTLYQGSAWKTLLAYYQASQIWPFRQPSTTFQEIRASGELQVIRNADLRGRIARHYDDSSGSHVLEVLGVVPRYREHVRGLTPWAIQSYIWSHCYTSDGGLGQKLVDCASPIPEAQAAAIIEQLRQDAALTQELRFWTATVGTMQTILGAIAHQGDDLAGAIADELARR